MGRTNRYPDEVRRRAIEEVVKRGRTSTAVAKDLGITQTTISNWVKQYRRDHGQEPGPTTDQINRIKELERENAELKRTNEILKRASAFFAVEADRTRTK